MKFLFLISFLHPLFSWASPNLPVVGDRSTISFVGQYCNPRSCAIIRIPLLTQSLVEYDATNDNFRIQFNPPEGKSEWIPRADIVKNFYLDPIATCISPDELETVTVRAGTFQTCRREKIDGNNKTTTWYGLVPFRVVKLVFDEDDGQGNTQSGTEELVDFSWGQTKY